MAEIVSVSKLKSRIKEFKKKAKSIVLVGGCFDILHPGHVIFLQKAKRAGDILIVLLESDQKVKKLKGLGRPIHSQVERAKILSELKSVDFVILLPFLEKATDYDQLISKLRPNIIASTLGNFNTGYLKRSAKLVSAKFKFVTKKVGDYSSTKILAQKS